MGDHRLNFELDHESFGLQFSPPTEFGSGWAGSLFCHDFIQFVQRVVGARERQLELSKFWGRGSHVVARVALGADTNSQLFGSVRFKLKGGDHIQMSGVLINCASGPSLD